MSLVDLSRALKRKLGPLRFGPPVTHVYNPLEYAWTPYRLYLNRYGSTPREIVLVGMNPGPWGMAQTGVPFGEVEHVRDWLEIEGKVERPKKEHEKRPIEGFDCQRSEVSGARFWGWAKKQYKTPDRFFERFFVANYCPLTFMEQSARNRTPDKLKPKERERLFAICDATLKKTVEWLEARYVIGVGAFAEKRAEESLEGLDVTIGRIMHPSPANPHANRGWEKVVNKELKELGIAIP